MEYRSLQATAEAQIAEVNARLKMKSFENERVALQVCVRAFPVAADRCHGVFNGACSCYAGDLDGCWCT